MKKNAISIAGNIASGKSEVAKLLSSMLKMKVYSASDAVRELAKSKHLTMLELNEYIEKNPEYDKLIDERTKTFAINNDNYILDARLGFFVAPTSFKVFISTDKSSAANRLLLAASERGEVETYKTLQEANDAILIREGSEHNRYMRIYNVDIYDMANYNFVIDSTGMSSHDVAKAISEEYTKWINKD